MREFSGFGKFATHLLLLEAEGGEVTNHITQKSAELVQRNAKARLGDYQDATGPFNAWAELADSTKEDRVSKGYAENEPLVREGDLRDSIEVERHHHEAVIGSRSEIAMWQELGTDRGIPPRPFLGPALYDSKLAIAERAAGTMVAWLCGLGWKRPVQKIEMDLGKVEG